MHPRLARLATGIGTSSAADSRPVLARPPKIKAWSCSITRSSRFIASRASTPTPLTPSPRSSSAATHIFGTSCDAHPIPSSTTSLKGRASFNRLRKPGSTASPYAHAPRAPLLFIPVNGEPRHGARNGRGGQEASQAQGRDAHASHPQHGAARWPSIGTGTGTGTGTGSD